MSTCGVLSPTGARNNLLPSIHALGPPCGKHIMYPLTPLYYVHGVCIESPFPREVRVGVAGGIGCWAGMGGSSSMRLVWGAVGWWVMGGIG